MNNITKDSPIGIFDSGVGGLTVLKALRKRMPYENLLYLGDTARVPYGTKSAETIIRYAIQATQLLVNRRIKLLVVACNTASAVAINALRSAYNLPVIGVIKPGAKAVCDASKIGIVAVIATERTVDEKAYEKEIQLIRPCVSVVSKACPLFVALAEEGWVSGSLVEAIAWHYLKPLFNDSLSRSPDCLLLGCTHFPALASAINNVLGGKITIIDSADPTAISTREELISQNLLREANIGNVWTKFLSTDGSSRFFRIGKYFWSYSISADDVEIVDL